ncbi:hypothetical protein LEP1GSC172_4332 [Leptospira noguchii]|uniref:Uncharacterized protein n=2 Tax=Leptospira noguchii TaxID=28182 RepID=M6VI68_9LEPT|nr:hypothetical protein LEP1GSC172_4332 [Leptospira noguchii]
MQYQLNTTKQNYASLGLFIFVVVYQINCISSFYSRKGVSLSDNKKMSPIEMKIFVNSNISNAWTRENYEVSTLIVDNVSHVFSDLIYKRLKSNSQNNLLNSGDTGIEYQGIVKINYYASIYTIIIQTPILGLSYGMIPALLPMRHNIEIYFYDKSGKLVWYRITKVDLMSYFGVPFVFTSPWYSQRENYVDLYQDVINQKILEFNNEISKK